MSAVQFGVIGGSGLYQMEALEIREERRVTTPFGDPSDAFVLGTLGGQSIAFLARHGRGHRLMPSELNFRANLWAFKALGVERLVSLSAVGSMKEAYEPTHIVVPDQFIDRTRHRPDTFFGDGVVGHIGFGDPICPELLELFYAAGVRAGATMHKGGTYLCMEGPQFSTRAESLLYRSWGVDVIGMTNLQEAKLAREAEICYATLALITDYDCWHEDEEDVSVLSVLDVLERNAQTAQNVVAEILVRLASAPPRACRCGTALDGAIMTDREHLPPRSRERLRPILQRVLGEPV